MRQELLPKANATCKLCGNAYYVCRRCIELRDKGIYAWKLDCDTPQCYQIYNAVNAFKADKMTKNDAKEVIATAQMMSSVREYIPEYTSYIEEIFAPEVEVVVEQPKENPQIEKPVKTQTTHSNKKNKQGKRYGKH